MSRIGKRVLVIPEGVTVEVNNSDILVSGKLGSLELTVKPGINVTVEDKNVTVTRDNDSKELRSLHGTTNANIKNMIEGVSTGFKKELEINGVGYRVAKQGNNLNLTLGYSHPVIFEAPAGISFDVPNANTIIVRGVDKELVGQTAAEVRTKRPPEVYRGKGIKYADEVIRRKVGKTGKK